MKVRETKSKRRKRLRKVGRPDVTGQCEMICCTLASDLKKSAKVCKDCQCPADRTTSQ